MMRMAQMAVRLRQTLPLQPPHRAQALLTTITPAISKQKMLATRNSSTPCTTRQMATVHMTSTHKNSSGRSETSIRNRVFLMTTGLPTEMIMTCGSFWDIVSGLWFYWAQRKSCTQFTIRRLWRLGVGRIPISPAYGYSEGSSRNQPTTQHL